MASRVSLIQSRSIYVGTLNSVAPSDGNLIVTGNVGIGTTSPNEKLHVAGNVHAYAAGGINAGLFASTSAGATTIALRSNGVTHLNGGNVGIGTTSPAEILSISRVATDNYIKVEAGSTVSNYSGLMLTEYGINWGWALRHSAATDALYISYQDNTPTFSDSVTFTRSGNVGIGTTSPAYKLHVNGEGNGLYVIGANSAPYTQTIASFVYGGNSNSINIENQGGKASFQARDSSSNAMNLHLNPVGGNVGIGTTGPAVSLQVNASTAAIRLEETSASAKRLEFSIDSSAVAKISANQSAQSIAFETVGSERMRITDAGNVGIGTTNPTTALVIQGGGAGSAAVTIQHTAASGYSGIDFFENTGTLVGSLWHANSSGVASNQNAMTLSARNAGDKVYIVAGGYDPTTSGGITVSAGNVGIGTTSPATALDVSGDARFGGGATKLSVYSDSTYSGIFNGASLVSNESIYMGDSKIFIITAGTEKVRITSAGNVGIGTIIPGSRLQVTATSNSATTVDNGITILNDSGVNNCIAGIRLSTYGDSDGGLYPKQFIGAIRDGAFGAGKGSIVFCNRDAADTSVVALSDEKMRILPNGNVGIGTTSPGAKLEVTDEIRVSSGGSYASFTARNTGTTGGGGLLGYQNGVANAFFGVAGWYLGNSDTGIIVGTDSSSRPIRFYTNTERMRISGDGNVGIGTTSPSQKFVVSNGSAEVFRVYSTGEIVADTNYIYAAYSAGTSFYSQGPASFRGGIYNDTGTYLTINGGTSNNTYFNGNVGIGTTSPAAKLDVQTSGTSLGLRLGNTNGTNWDFYSYNDNNLYINNSNGTQLTILNSNGNVGIGTASPTQGLHVSSAIGSANTGITIQNTSTGNPQLRFLNSSGTEVLAMTYISGTTSSLYIYTAAAGNLLNLVGANVGIGTTSPTAKLAISSGSSNGLRIDTNSGGYAALNIGGTGTLTVDAPMITGGRFQVLDNGNVGIGVPSPSEKLHVDGNVIVTYNNSFQGINSIGNKAILARVSPTTGIINYAEYATAANLNGFVLGSDDARVKGDIATDSLDFITNTSSRMFINSSGNVGIGTTSPTNTLEVRNAFGASTYTPLRLTNSTGFSGANVEILLSAASNNAGVRLRGEAPGSNHQDFSLYVTNGGTLQSTPAIFVQGSSNNVGIGTTSPSYKLDVVGDSRITSGSLGVGVAPNATDGRIDASNDIVAYSTSDQRLKENVTPIENALEKVKTLTGVEFDWKEETAHVHGYHGHDVGIIAQDVQAVLPEAVRTNDSGYLSVRYEKMIALLIEANKELAARVELLEQKLKQ